MGDEIQAALQNLNQMLGQAPVRVSVPNARRFAEKAADLDGNPYPPAPHPPWIVNASDLDGDQADSWAKAMNAPVTYLPYSQDTEEALRSALLSILGDMPSASEDPWERCRAIAAEALGYQKPEPMERPSGRPWPPPLAEIPTYYDIHYDERRPVTQETVDNMERAIQTLVGQRDTRDTEIAMLRRALAAKDARIGELKSVLASTPVAFEDPDAKPPPAHNPFREFPRDQRRMGP